jgi:hypothetical protein
MPEFESSEVNEIGFLNWSHPFLNKESAAQSLVGVPDIIESINFNLMTI